MLKTKIVAFLGVTLTLASLLLGSRTLGYQRAVLSLQLGGLFLVLGGFFRLFDNHGLHDVLAVLYDLEETTD
jgi:phosphoglycerol transferase MdoB-like AlkP superfamily enzyme